MRYVSFLARINVGGNQLKMADLKAMLERHGFSDVVTVTASGNVIFTHPRASDAKLAEEMAGLIGSELGVKTFAVVRSRDELAAVLKDNPFHGKGEDRLVHSYLLEAAPTKDGFAKLETDHKGPEKIAAGRGALHVDYVEGAGNSKLTAPFIEKRIGVRGTGRNMSSLKRILARMDED